MDKIADFLHAGELKLIKNLNTPEKIQKYIDTQITYDPHREDRTIKEVVKDKKAECYNSALFAAVCLLNAGYESSIIELLAKEDEEHILCVYKQNGYWGSIAQSKFAGLKGRKPMYKSIRDLVVSYVEFYFEFDGHYSLMSYSNPIQLEKYNMRWLNDRNTVNRIAKDLRNKKHYQLKDFKNGYLYVSTERYWREVLFVPNYFTIPEKYLQHKPANVDL